MKIYKKLLFFLLLTIETFVAQQTFEVTDNFEQAVFNKYIQVHATLDSIHPSSLLNNSVVEWKKNEVSYGFSNHFYWLRFSLKNVSTQEKNLYFEVKNPHVRFVEFYIPKENKLQLAYQAGRYLPFDARPIDNVRLVFPIHLKLSEEKTFYVKVDKRTSSVSFPTELWNENTFLKESNRLNLLNGFLFGGILLVALYTLIMFFNLRRTLYLWYFGYTVSLGLYLFTTAGYSFQYIISNSVFFNSFFRVFVLAFTLYFHAKFVQSLLKTSFYFKKLHVIINGLSVAILIVTFGGAFLRVFNLISSSFYIKSIYVIAFLLIMYFIIVGVRSYAKQPKLSSLYLLAFGVLLSSAILMIIEDYGWFSEIKLSVSPLFVGALIEIVILSIALVREMNLIFKEKNTLEKQMIVKEQEVTKAFIDGIEKERLRISEELHDDIGSQLSNLNKYIVQRGASKTTQNKLERIITDVRNISHKLSPNKSNFFTFNEQLMSIVDETLGNTEIDFNLSFSQDFTNLTNKQQLNIYRIVQEFLHNTIKHSHASILEIELTQLDESLILIIEDNGIGFNISEKKRGLGLLNIQRRVDYLQGTFEISSRPNSGTHLLVSIPLK